MLEGTLLMVMRERQVLLIYFRNQTYPAGLVIEPAALLPEHFFPNPRALNTLIPNTMCSCGLNWI